MNACMIQSNVQSVVVFTSGFSLVSGAVAASLPPSAMYISFSLSCTLTEERRHHMAVYTQAKFFLESQCEIKDKGSLKVLNHNLDLNF